MKAEVDKVLPQIPGVQVRTGDWGMFWRRHRGRSAGGERVRVFGDSTARLNRLVAELRASFVGVEGVTSTETRFGEESDELVIEPDAEKLSRFGLTSDDLSRRIAASFGGSILREIRSPTGDIPLRVEIAEEEKNSRSELEQLRLRTSSGPDLVLADLGSIFQQEGPREVRRENRQSSIWFTVNLEPSYMKDSRRIVESVLENYPFPKGYSYDLGRGWRQRQHNETQFGEGILLAVFLVYLVMACLFESLRQPLVLMVTVLLALPGAIWFLYLHGNGLDLPASIGCILLAGIVVNNGIVLIDHINRYRSQGLEMHEAIRLGGEERLRPILITALTTVIGLCPMAYGGAKAVGVYYHSLARTIVGGLTVSTLLTLVVLPVLYSVLVRQGKRGKAEPSV